MTESKKEIKPLDVCDVRGRMKFGKQLKRVKNLSDPEWSPFWMNYASLKGMIASIEREQKEVRAKNDADPDTRNKKIDLTSLQSETTFFRQMNWELKKTSKFFVAMEESYGSHRARVESGLEEIQKPEFGACAEDWNNIMSACLRLYRELLLLENYAVMCYVGFSKILKKHDRWTGYTVRDKFMRSIVNPQPFANYPRLLQMIEQAEQIFRAIRTNQPAELNASTPATLAGSDGRVQAIRGIMDDASRMQQSERESLLTSGSPLIAAAPDPTASTSASTAASQRTDDELARTWWLQTLASEGKSGAEALLSLNAIAQPQSGIIAAGATSSGQTSGAAEAEGGEEESEAAATVPEERKPHSGRTRSAAAEELPSAKRRKPGARGEPRPLQNAISAPTNKKPRNRNL